MLYAHIHCGSVKTVKDSQILSGLQRKYKISFDDHTEKSMWFSGEQDNLLKFVTDLLDELKYLKVTVGVIGTDGKLAINLHLKEDQYIDVPLPESTKAGDIVYNLKSE